MTNDRRKGNLAMKSLHKLGVAAAVGCAAILLAPSAAFADVEHQSDFVFGEQSVTVEYGEYWSLYGATPEASGFFGDAGTKAPTAVATRGGTSYPLTIDNYRSYTFLLEGPVYRKETEPVLAAGEYSVTVSGRGRFEVGSYNPAQIHWYNVVTPQPASLVIKPAALSAEVRIGNDTNDRDGLIIAGRLSGDFVDSHAVADVGAFGQSPGGTWKFVLTDSAGEIALEKTVESLDGKDVFAQSFYWHDAKPGETYEGTLEFTPTPGSAGNFIISAPQPVTITMPELQRAVPVSSATAVTESPAAPEFTLPLWIVLLAGVIVTALAAAVAILSVKFVRNRGHATPAASTPDAAVL